MAWFLFLPAFFLSLAAVWVLAMPLVFKPPKEGPPILRWPMHATIAAVQSLPAIASGLMVAVYCELVWPGLRLPFMAIPASLGAGGCLTIGILAIAIAWVPLGWRLRRRDAAA